MSTEVTVERVRGRWWATIETTKGPLTAIGETVVEAKLVLDQLLGVMQVMEAKRRRERILADIGRNNASLED